MRKMMLAMAMIGLLVPATSCTLTRDASGRLMVEHTNHSARGQYRPWCDLNSGGLPPWWWGSGFGPPYNATPSQWTMPYERQ
jgi:hypothetical protein